jgi:hypothetical protein
LTLASSSMPRPLDSITGIEGSYVSVLFKSTKAPVNPHTSPCRQPLPLQATVILHTTTSSCDGQGDRGCGKRGVAMTARPFSLSGHQPKSPMVWPDVHLPWGWCHDNVEKYATESISRRREIWGVRLTRVNLNDIHGYGLKASEKEVRW